MTAYVALDLETTGLDPESDEIIEVGAVRFTEEGVVDTFRSLVNPRRTIDYRIQRLTGIDPAEMASAPSFAEVASGLEAFIGQDPVVGQNVQFDVSFLARKGIVPPGPSYDTRDLAALLVPGLAAYSLRGIMRGLLIEFPVQHRALEDAQAAQAAFLELRARLFALDQRLLEEAERIAHASDWGLRHLLREAVGAPRALEPIVTDDQDRDFICPPGAPGPEIRPAPEPQEVGSGEVRDLLTSVAARVMDGFEHRDEQLHMAEAVRRALMDGEHLIVEAGTGVGKSLAYLTPSAIHAVRNGERVVVSTNTINLQEQLANQDIPLVQRLLSEAGIDGLRATQLKGRRNYLCLLRWQSMRRQPSLTADEARLLVKTLFWLQRTQTGDLAELNLTSGEDSVWSRLSAQDEACLASSCPFVRDGRCFLVRARKRAETAHVVVVNHALLLSDVRSGGNLLPPADYLVVDEAHHLEAEATRQFGFEAAEGDLERFLGAAHAPGPRGRDGGLAGDLRAFAGAAGGAKLSGAANSMGEAAARARERVGWLFGLLAEFVREHGPAESDYDRTLLLTRAMRVQPGWSKVETMWEEASASLGDVIAWLEAVPAAMAEVDLGGERGRALEAEALAAEATDLALRGRRLQEGIDGILLKDDPDVIAWLTISRRDAALQLQSAPLRVATLLRDAIFERKLSVVLTSATLSTEGNFEYVKERLGLEEPREMLLGSPFDYANSTLVLVPREMPEPSTNTYQQAIQEAVVQLCLASQGRALILFTSYGALRATYYGVRGALADEGILALGHGIDGSPKQLIERLRDNDRTVVMGTASFWEGVDVVGEALCLLVIARLPFSVPTDPVFEARSALFDDPFNQYAVPQAVLRFKQGFGRLIRRKTDRGVMVTLDRRVLSKRYGQAFLNSLPACRVQEIARRDMADAVRSWLDRA